MRKYFKPLMIVAAMTTSVSALAIQKDITVNASVDSQLDMTQADNTPLPASIDMQYLPGRGLESYRLNTKVWSNSATSNVKVRLVSAAKLANADGAETIPMTVKLGDKTLSTADVEYTGTELFPGSIENGSAVLPLTISQTTKGILKNRSVQRRCQPDADAGDDHGRRCVTPQHLRNNVRGCPPSDVRIDVEARSWRFIEILSSLLLCYPLPSNSPAPGWPSHQVLKIWQRRSACGQR